MKTLGRYTIGLVYISAYLSISAQLGVINRRLGVLQLGWFIWVQPINTYIDLSPLDFFFFGLYSSPKSFFFF